MSDSHDDSKITTRRFRRPRGVPARGARGRRVILAVAAAGALAAALLGAPPAHAAGCNLRFYYNVDGSAAWPSASAASEMSCSATPAIVRYAGGTTIADNSDFPDAFLTYVNTDGSPNWWKNDGWGGGGTIGPLAMTPYSGGTEFAIPYSNELIYGWETGGQRIQSGTAELVASSGISLFAPAIARNSTTTVIAATGQDNSLWFYWNADGSPAWGSRQIVDSWSAYGAPAITADDNGTEIAFIAPDASLWFYWNANGTSTWHPEQVAGPGTMQGAPAMVAANHTAEIAVTATDGSLRFYWSPEGTTTWYGEQMAPPGTTSSSPAMTRFSGGTEIAVTGP